MDGKKIEAEIAKIEAEREEVFKQMKPLEDKSTRLYNKLKKKKGELTKAILLDASFEDKIKYLITESGSDGLEKHVAAEKFFKNLGLETSGYFPKTGQRRVRVSLIRGCDKSLEGTLSGLNKVLPFIKPIDGEKLISIFEHTLSEYGSYSIAISNSYDVVKHTYGRKSVEKSFNSLLDCLKYVQYVHYYELKDAA